MVGGRCVVDIVTFCGSLVVDLTSKVNINRLFTPTAYGFVSLRIWHCRTTRRSVNCAHMAMKFGTHARSQQYWLVDGRGKS